MSFLSFLLGEKKNTANVAKERLQIILAHERDSSKPQAEYLPALQRELIAVISKYVSIDPADISVKLERQANLDVLAVKIELPEKPEEEAASPAKAAAARVGLSTGAERKAVPQKG